MFDLFLALGAYDFASHSHDTLSDSRLLFQYHIWGISSSTRLASCVPIAIGDSHIFSFLYRYGRYPQTS